MTMTAVIARPVVTMKTDEDIGILVYYVNFLPKPDVVIELSHRNRGIIHLSNMTHRSHRVNTSAHCDDARHCVRALEHSQ